MALYHFHVTQIKRSAGQSAVASAAYRAGEKLYSEYYGESSDYSHKKGVICSEILLPPNAPLEYVDRQTLWNALEKAERNKDAQLAYSFDIALQNEFSLEFSGHAPQDPEGHHRSPGVRKKRGGIRPRHRSPRPHRP